MSTTRYRGVVWVPATAFDPGQWAVSIRVGRSVQHVGYFDDQTEAALAYDRAAKKYLDRPILNFTLTGKLNPMRLAERAVSSRSGRCNAAPATPRTPRSAASSRSASSGSSASVPRESSSARSADGSNSRRRRTEPAPPPRATAASDSEAQPGKYKGVFCEKRKWRARLFGGSMDRHLGTYTTAEEAARAVNRAAREYIVDPILNFLDDGSLKSDRFSKRTRYQLRSEPGEMEKFKEMQASITRSGARSVSVAGRGVGQEHGAADDKQPRAPAKGSAATGGGRGKGKEAADDMMVVQGVKQEQEGSDEASADGEGSEEDEGMEVDGGEEEEDSDTSSAEEQEAIIDVGEAQDEGDDEEEEEGSDESSGEDESSVEEEGMEVDGSGDEDDEDESDDDDEEAEEEEEEDSRTGCGTSSQLPVVIKQQGQEAGAPGHSTRAACARSERCGSAGEQGEGGSTSGASKQAQSQQHHRQTRRFTSRGSVQSL